MSHNLFNKNRYFELLKKEETLNHVNPYDLEAKELRAYQRILSDQIIYINRDLYISFLEEGLKETLENDFNLDNFDLDEFTKSLYSEESEGGFFKFDELYDQNLEDFERLKNKILKDGITVLDDFTIDSEAREFSKLISFIANLSDCLGETMDQNQYNITLEYALSELRNYATSASTNYNDTKVLTLTVIFFTILTSLVYSFLNPSVLNLVW